MLKVQEFNKFCLEENIEELNKLKNNGSKVAISIKRNILNNCINKITNIYATIL